MILAWLESFKYTGHLFPVALLRVYVGFFYFRSGLGRINQGELDLPYLVEQIKLGLAKGSLPHWYHTLIERTLIPQWQVMAYGMTVLELMIGASFIFGYLVRPFAINGLILTVFLMTWSVSYSTDFWRLILALHLVFLAVGAGRCVGMDHFFYKRRRGLWW